MSMLVRRIPCPECKREGERFEVDCFVNPQVLKELEVDDVEDVNVEELYRRHDNSDGVEIDGVCSECGSDYSRDDDGNITD
jgi:hypothetical protein